MVGMRTNINATRLSHTHYSRKVPPVVERPGVGKVVGNQRWEGGGGGRGVWWWGPGGVVGKARGKELGAQGVGGGGGGGAGGRVPGGCVVINRLGEEQ